MTRKTRKADVNVNTNKSSKGKDSKELKSLQELKDAKIETVEIPLTESSESSDKVVIDSVEKQIIDEFKDTGITKVIEDFKPIRQLFLQQSLSYHLKKAEAVNSLEVKRKELEKRFSQNNGLKVTLDNGRKFIVWRSKASKDKTVGGFWEYLNENTNVIDVKYSQVKKYQRIDNFAWLFQPMLDGIIDIPLGLNLLNINQCDEYRKKINQRMLELNKDNSVYSAMTQKQQRDYVLDAVVPKVNLLPEPQEPQKEPQEPQKEPQEQNNYVPEIVTESHFSSDRKITIKYDQGEKGYKTPIEMREQLIDLLINCQPSNGSYKDNLISESKKIVVMNSLLVYFGESKISSEVKKSLEQQKQALKKLQS